LAGLHIGMVFEMDEDFEFVTVRPKWALRDLFLERDRKEKKLSILVQIKQEYLSTGWELVEEIEWEKGCRFAVAKLKPPLQAGHYSPTSGLMVR
jgi:hypothetical protein